VKSKAAAPKKMIPYFTCCKYSCSYSIDHELVDSSRYENAIIIWNAVWPLASWSCVRLNFNPYSTIKTAWDWANHSIYLRDSVTITTNDHVNVRTKTSMFSILKSLDSVWIDRSALVQWVCPNDDILISVTR